jgi:hypothetical protein
MGDKLSGSCKFITTNSPAATVFPPVTVNVATAPEVDVAVVEANVICVQPLAVWIVSELDIVFARQYSAYVADALAVTLVTLKPVITMA